MSTSGFPKLIPAFTAYIEIDPPSVFGTIARGNPLNHVVILPSSTIKSEPGYPIQLDATFVSGGDFIKADPDGRHVRLEVQSLAKDKATGGFVRFNYTGTVFMGGAAGKVLRGDAGAATTPFGDAFMTPIFETGVPELADIQNKIYVGAGRFVLESGKPVAVEYKISEVTA
ncbi:hypothetical protein QBC47DRAFT_414252 [Echria macrotheca]|uniref:Uncharacterized protein n=1 Tax=Echria macrotheca TaxID=438768 RepID=A0AAJ0BEK6_9PEZI|nr:hypothetical protein QBC47DRAFT_414252 [Echria macrotheca]